MALAPADTGETFVFLPIEEPQQQLAALPATAGFLPLFGLLGGMWLLLGGWLTAIRHRVIDPSPRFLPERGTTSRSRRVTRVMRPYL
jgi:hypothetical protein